VKTGYRFDGDLQTIAGGFCLFVDFLGEFSKKFALEVLTIRASDLLLLALPLKWGLLFT